MNALLSAPHTNTIETDSRPLDAAFSSSSVSLGTAGLDMQSARELISQIKEDVLECAAIDPALRARLLSDPAGIVSEAIRVHTDEKMELGLDVSVFAHQEQANHVFLVVNKDAPVNSGTVLDDLMARASNDPGLLEKLIRAPKEVLRNELGDSVSLPDDLKVTVLVEDERTLHLVLPREPVTSASESITPFERIGDSELTMGTTSPSDCGTCGGTVCFNCG